MPQWYFMLYSAEFFLGVLWFQMSMTSALSSSSVESQLTGVDFPEPLGVVLALLLLRREPTLSGVLRPERSATFWGVKVLDRDRDLFTGDFFFKSGCFGKGVFLPDEDLDLELTLDVSELLSDSSDPRRWRMLISGGYGGAFASPSGPHNDSTSLIAEESDTDEAQDDEDSNITDILSGFSGAGNSCVGSSSVALTASRMSSWSAHTRRPWPTSKMLSVMSAGQKEFGHSEHSLVEALPQMSQWCHGQSHLPAIQQPRHQSSNFSSGKKQAQMIQF